VDICTGILPQHHPAVKHTPINTMVGTGMPKRKPVEVIIDSTYGRTEPHTQAELHLLRILRKIRDGHRDPIVPTKMADYFLRHGAFFTSAPIPKIIRDHVRAGLGGVASLPSQCYLNTKIFVENAPYPSRTVYVYAEGLALVPTLGKVIPHAWVVDAEKDIVRDGLRVGCRGASARSANTSGTVVHAERMTVSVFKLIYERQDFVELLLGRHNLTGPDMVCPASQKQQRVQDLVRVSAERDQELAIWTVLRIKPVSDCALICPCQRHHRLDCRVGVIELSV
jgi:hypothetical protein